MPTQLTFLPTDDLITECESCGVILTTENRPAVDVDICEDCSITCGNCGNIHSRDETTEIGDLDVCLDCRDHNYVVCDRCREFVVNDGAYYVDNGDIHVCENCYYESYGHCSGCDECFHIDYLYYSESDDCSYCESCNEERHHACGLHDYSYKPRPVFFRHSADSSNIFYGMEVEVDNGDDVDSAISDSDLENSVQFYCKRDSSLNDGFEVVSHPGHYRYWIEQSLEWTSVVRRNGFRSYNTETCGMHVHVSRDAFSTLSLSRLLIFCKHNEQFLRYVSRRKQNCFDMWCRNDTTDKTVGRLIREKIKGRSDRHSLVNTTNCSTIEFRLFRGTLAIDAIKRNLAFVASMVHFVRECDTPSINMSGYLAFIHSNRCKELLGDKYASKLITWVCRFVPDGHVSSVRSNGRIL